MVGGELQATSCQFKIGYFGAGNRPTSAGFGLDTYGVEISGSSYLLSNFDRFSIIPTVLGLIPERALVLSGFFRSATFGAAHLDVVHLHRRYLTMTIPPRG